MMRAVVIGSGLVGLAIAWRLHRCDVHVTLVDPTPTCGATHAAAGMLAAVTETYYEEELFADLLLASAAAYPAFVAEVEGVTGQPAGYRATQTLLCGTDAADRGTLADLHGLVRSLGRESEPLSTREARRLEPLLGPALSAAFLVRGDHQVDPRVLSRTLLHGLARGGARILPARAAAVTHAGPDPDSPVTGVRLEDSRTLTADAVVVANGLDVAALEGLPVDLTGLVRPVHGDILRLATPPHLAGALTRTVRGLVAGHAVYVVPRADGSLVLGATTREDGRPGVNAGGVHELLRDAIRLVPAIAECDLHESIARARPTTPDNAPLLGALGSASAENLIVATGFGRNGILLAPAAADAVAAALGVAPDETLTDLPDLTPFAPDRFAIERTPA